MHKNNNKNKNEILCFLFTIGIFLIIWTIPSFVWLGYANAYKDQMFCNSIIVNDSSTNFMPVVIIRPNEKLAAIIGIHAFIITNAGISICEAVFVFFAVWCVLCSANGSQEAMCGAACLIILAVFCCIFRLAWLIIGGVMFWRDCPNIAPEPINNVMWAMLIMGYIGFWGTSCLGAVGAAKK